VFRTSSLAAALTARFRRTAHAPIRSSRLNPPYDGAAAYTFRERGTTGDGFEFINFHFSTHQRTTTVRYPQVSRTQMDTLGSTSTVTWSGTITAVMGPGVS